MIANIVTNTHSRLKTIPWSEDISNKKYVLSNSEFVQCNFFIFWLRDVYPVQHLLLCTEFHRNRMIFRWDMAIYRFSKWRPSAILELFYHHTRPPTTSLAGRSCLSNFMSIWYTDLPFEFFVYLAWNAYSGPQNGFFLGTLDPPKCDYSSYRDPQRHILA